MTLKELDEMAIKVSKKKYRTDWYVSIEELEHFCKRNPEKYSEYLVWLALRDPNSLDEEQNKVRIAVIEKIKMLFEIRDSVKTETLIKLFNKRYIPS